jgi:hypothetical protein
MPGRVRRRQWPAPGSLSDEHLSSLRALQAHHRYVVYTFENDVYTHDAPWLDVLREAGELIVGLLVTNATPEKDPYRRVEVEVGQAPRDELDAT